MASGSGESLPYLLKNLNWDPLHHFNAQNKYSYTGKGRKLKDPMLQCDLCEQWFHLGDTSVVPKDAKFVAFQRNYRFSCRICAGGAEQFELQINTWTSIALTALYNLLLSPDGTSLQAGVWIKIKDVVSWIEQHWGGLTTGRNLAQLTENNAVAKCFLYAQNQATFQVSDDRTEVLLKHVAASKLLLKPLVSQPVPDGKVPVAKGSSRAPAPGGGNKRKRGTSKAAAAANRAANEPPAPEAPTLDQIKLPEKYKLIPVPKPLTGLALQDMSIVQLSRTARAPQIQLKEDDKGRALTAVGYKGYRMVRATHGVGAGCWYYEIKIKPPLNEEDGHTRIGWCTDSGDVQAPVGYDVNSYAYRDSEGTKFHESQGHEYGEAYGPGDVIGCMLRMGEPIGIARERQRVSLKGQEFIVEEERKREPSHGSEIAFFKNGQAQGTAFSDLWAEVYYPAISLYKAACVEFNFGPNFAFPPPAGLNARAVSELATPKEDAGDEGDEAGGLFGDVGATMNEAAHAAEDEGEEMDEGA